ncbi:MAG: DUF1674 domain-containing protein [Gammaproteobacteria bacterium]
MQSDDNKEMNASAPKQTADFITKDSRRNREVAEESGGPPGPEPTRYGDWEKNGRCIDF